MPPVINDIVALLGVLFRFLGFLIAGYAIGRFVFDNYKMSEWQVRIALALGFFGLFVGVTAYAGPGSAGAFAFGSGIALLVAVLPRKDKAAGAEEDKTAG
jgi:hypothetical protein